MKNKLRGLLLLICFPLHLLLLLLFCGEPAGGVIIGAVLAAVLFTGFCTAEALSLFTRKTASIRDFAHDFLPALFQTGLVLAADLAVYFLLLAGTARAQRGGLWLAGCMTVPMLCTLIGSGASALIILFRGGTEKTADILPTAFMMIMMIMLLMSVMIPLRVKYNSEKSKTIQFIIYGALLLGVFGIGALLEKMGIDAGGAMESFFTSVSPYALFAGMLVICLCILFVSVRISERIIEKKEY